MHIAYDIQHATYRMCNIIILYYIYKIKCHL